MAKVELFWGENIRPVGEFILIEMRKDTRELVSKGGILEPSKEKESRRYGKIRAIGSKVKEEEIDFKIGDIVVYNDYDVKFLEEHETKTIYAITRPQSIMAVYEIE